jgi:hypothetical protein
MPKSTKLYSHRRSIPGHTQFKMAYKNVLVATAGLWALGGHAFPAFPFGDHSVVGDCSRASHDITEYDFD